MTAYKNLGFDMADYPRAYAFFENEITLPLHTKLSDEEVDYIVQTLVRISEEILGSGKKIIKKILTKKRTIAYNILNKSEK